MELKIWHNPRCQKSREALKILQQEGLDPEVILYLEHPPSADELHHVVQLLGTSVHAIIRKEEALFKSDYKDKNLDDKAWYEVLHQNPKLIQRPIVIKDQKAAIGRPPENISSLLKK